MGGAANGAPWKRSGSGRDVAAGEGRSPGIPWQHRPLAAGRPRWEIRRREFINTKIEREGEAPEGVLSLSVASVRCRVLGVPMEPGAGPSPLVCRGIGC